MKKILVIFLLFVSIVSLGQDLRTVDWKTRPTEIRLIGIDTFKLTVNFIDINDKGVGLVDTGYFLVDWIARCFEIIDFENDTVTVVDLAGENIAPFENQVANIYESIVEGDTSFHSIGGTDASVRDELSAWKEVARNNELFGRSIQGKVPYVGAIDDVDLDTFGIKAHYINADSVFILDSQAFTNTTQVDVFDTTLVTLDYLKDSAYYIIQDTLGRSLDSIVTVIDSTLEALDSVISNALSGTGYFEKELTEDENEVDIGFRISATAIVFTNGDAIPRTEWEYEDSTLTLYNPVQLYDLLILFQSNLEGNYFEKELTTGETVISVGFELTNITLVTINGDAIRSSLWSGIGGNSITLGVAIKEYDLIIVKN